MHTIAGWPDEPMALFRDWFARAGADNGAEPETMTVCTATPDGRPSARILLLRGLDHGFCFFTNYESRKGRELDANPNAALVFYWPQPYLQVRVEGTVERMSAEESDAYFDSRERAKQLSAVVSQQSRPIADWRELRAEADKLMQSDAPVSRPKHWGGFRLLPHHFEFWSGSRDRMHHRCAYTLMDGKWSRELLAP